MNSIHETYIKRCLQLAQQASAAVAPNPMVGAVLVHNNIIIGEGYHQKFGDAHAEVNCINSVPSHLRHLIPQSTLYVSLEPCCHHGKTPPCTSLILEHGIKTVVVGARDPFEKVNGSGIQILRDAGVEVIEDILASECRNLNASFFHFHQKQKPFIILKWAQTSNGFIGTSNQRLLISNPLTTRLVHQWRAQSMAILVGKNTVMIDNPQLTVRYCPGSNPLRMVIDPQLELSFESRVFDDAANTIVFNQHRSFNTGRTIFSKYDTNAVEGVLNYCNQNNIHSVLVEGGAHTLQQFIHSGHWNEARVITAGNFAVPGGVTAPTLQHATLFNHLSLMEDHLHFYINNNS